MTGVDGECSPRRQLRLGFDGEVSHKVSSKRAERPGKAKRTLGERVRMDKRSRYVAGRAMSDV